MGFRRLPFFVMNSILQRHIVLDVNRLQQAIGTRTVGEAIVAMTGDNGMKPPAQSFDIEYGRRADGSYDMKEVLDRRPVGWAEWITLPVRPCDLAIRTARGEIRAPTVIMAPEYWNMPVSRPKLNAKAIKERDGYVCQYTGRKLRPDEANLDPEHGGLVVWDKAAPLDWDFAKFNADIPAARDFLTRSGARPATIPHRANRAVIFDSDLFHETDTITFREGYENRRINCTLLYGFRDTKP